MSRRPSETGEERPPFPDLALLHERHYGITQGKGAAYSEAAAVCLSRHHVPPTAVTVSYADNRGEYTISWPPPDARTRQAWNNADDATRDGAYCVVLAAAEVHLGLTALGRTRTRSGTDYLIGPLLSLKTLPQGALNLEGAVRLEISGMDQPASEATLRGRLAEKVRQARHGGSVFLAMAGVVGFSLCLVLFRKVE